ncbi:MAG: efflux RND transporter periplasmic adaptor subunit [Planctomycetota bacterium]|jgi:RND family efflux transporter MFP subunit
MRIRTAKFLLFLLILSIAIPAVPNQADFETTVAAITAPSADVTLSFVQPGRIAEVNIKEGQPVKAGQVLVQQDDAVERANLAQLEAASENTLNIQAGEASLAQKQVDLKKLEKAAALNAATALEVEHAKLDVKVADLSVKLAVFEHEQAQRKFDEAKIQIDNMSLKSPIDGITEKLEVETGESVNALEDVVRIVQINPLWIETPVPLEKAGDLRYGDKTRVIFPGPEETSLEGTIVFIGAVADAASRTLRVRIQVPNRSLRPAGEHVRIVFSTSQNKTGADKK